MPSNLSSSGTSAFSADHSKLKEAAGSKNNRRTRNAISYKPVNNSKLQKQRRLNSTKDSSLNMATAEVSPRPRSLSPRMATPRSQRFPKIQDYDARMDNHQQTYVLSPRMMSTLKKTIHEQNGKLFTDPSDKIGFHGPRRPLLLSYPVSPRHIGNAIFVKTYRKRGDRSPGRSVTLAESKENKEAVKLAFNMRTCESKDFNPAPKKLPRPKTVQPSQSKAVKLAKEKGFVLDGVALSSIQDDFGKVQPKLGPAIPPYNSHFDRHVQNYFGFKGLNETLIKTGQTRKFGESIQGRAVDRFHFIGVGHDYLSRRNKSGAGYSRDLVDGHDQFLSDSRPLSGYNGKFGYRRNTPLLRHCPSPFGTASRSSTF